MRNNFKKILAGVTALALITVTTVETGILNFNISNKNITNLTAFADDDNNNENATAKTYTVNITLMQFQSSTAKSMGNEAMIQNAHVIVNADGTASLQIDMIPMTYIGKDGYLGSLKKVTKVVKENRYHYPTEIETSDAKVLEEYTGVYDTFNDPNSEYADKNVSGIWYPKKISLPIDFANKEDDILVQVYVPVMESIMAGGGTKFAVLDIKWDTLKEGIAGDVNSDGISDATDIELTKNYILKTQNTDLNNWQVADFDNNNKLNALDITLMKQYLNKKN